MDFLQFFESIFGNHFFLLCVTTFSFLLKIIIFAALAKKSIHSNHSKRPWLFLLLVLISSAVTDSAWVVKLIQLQFAPNMDYRIVLFWLRLAWAAFVIQYFSLSLFIESLVEKKYILPIRQKLNALISIILIFSFIFFIIFYFNCYSATERPYFERLIQTIESFYLLFIVIPPSLYITSKKLQIGNQPRILKKQLRILIQGLIIPHLISDLVHLFPFSIFHPTFVTRSYAVVGLSTILLTYAIYYCSKKTMGLRFLNFSSHVESPMNVNFIDDFKGILERLSHVTNVRELSHITQSFFKETFRIPLGKTRLVIRKIDHTKAELRTHYEEDPIVAIVETFIGTHQEQIQNIAKRPSILIYDEIDFSHFYEETNRSKVILNFMETINADIFIPIYDKDQLIAYILVDRFARINDFYSNVERDEMIVFASYLGNIINLLQNKSLDALIEQEQSLKKELYNKHQEINQYKESIRSFLKTNKQKQIGIIFYKNRHFTFGNQAAKEMIEINLNKQEGHQLTQDFKRLAQQVESFKAPQILFTQDVHGVKIVLSAVPHLEQNNVIITISYPDVSDVIKQQIDLLKDPSEWDYLLYLQTTQSGKLINQLIPGTGETLLNFKIELLKIALSKKAILLDIPEEDLRATVELLHHISLRDTLHTLTLQGPSQNYDIAITLFGINPIFGMNTSSEQPLLQKLDENGTLFIKNIHYLDLETQEHLAELIKYGYYRIFKSEQRVNSNVRIICSSNQNLAQMTQEGTFSKALFQELKQTQLIMPSLMTLPEHELHTLADGFIEQALQKNEFHNLLVLSPKEKTKLAYKRPTSLQELKTEVQKILVNKSKKNNIYHETEFDPAYEVSDPELIQAARLGKQALKDRKIMIFLWNKFKNQNKIATLLGVNRSSVNRRCKEFNLE